MQVEMPNPDMKGRRKIFILYLAKIKYDDSVDIESITSGSIGFSEATLQDMVNTAAIQAAVENNDMVKKTTINKVQELHNAPAPQVMGDKKREEMLIADDLLLANHNKDIDIEQEQEEEGGRGPACGPAGTRRCTHPRPRPRPAGRGPACGPAESGRPRTCRRAGGDTAGTG